MLYAIVAVLVIIADQWVKYWVAGSISMSSAGEPLIPGILSLVNLHNDGAAFSFLSGSGARIYFIILTGVFVLAVILALATRFISGKLARWSIVLVAAGGLSNCIDRVIYGYVQDMFKTEFINFPVFNLADVFITVFCILFVLAIIFERDKSDDDDYDDLYDEDEEEDLPRRKSAKEKRAARAAAKAEAEEAKAEKRSRKARKEAEEDEYEQYKAARAARQRQQQRPAVKPVRPVDNGDTDPFAEWERANAAVSGQKSAARTPAAPRTAAPAAKPAAAPAVKPAAAPAARPVAPAARPAAPAAKPAAAPAAKPAAPQAAPKASSGNDEFFLEDILAEFK